MAVVPRRNTFGSLGEIADGPQGLRGHGANRDRHREAKRQHTRDDEGERGYLAGPMDRGRQHGAREGERERDREHGHVRPRGESRARAGQGVTDAGVTSEGGPDGPQCSFWEAVHSGQRGGSSGGSAQDPVLDEPRRARSGDRPDEHQYEGELNRVA